MNVLKTAIVGLALISANAPVRADVIADWNNTAMDVMKAVNVAGNPWTRSMALVNVSMSDAVNSVQNRYSRYIPELPADPNASPATTVTTQGGGPALLAHYQNDGGILRLVAGCCENRSHWLADVTRRVDCQRVVWRAAAWREASSRLSGTECAPANCV